MVYPCDNVLSLHKYRQSKLHRDKMLTLRVLQRIDVSTSKYHNHIRLFSSRYRRKGFSSSTLLHRRFGSSASSNVKITPGFVIGGLGLYVVSVGVGYMYWQVSNGCPCDESAVSELELRKAYENADEYDENVEWSEWLSMDSLRAKLLEEERERLSKGKVLEVAAGTGRNFKHYPDKCRLTITDTSKEMLEKSKNRIKDSKIMVEEFALVDAHGLSNHFESNKFDVVVDTFGLCSFHNPQKALREMSRVTKKNGVILLLEHGRSSPHLNGSISRFFGGSWLSSILDLYAERHARRWGCWWNRDIMNLVRESGLKVDSVKTFQMGTVYLIRCRPSCSPP